MRNGFQYRLLIGAVVMLSFGLPAGGPIGFDSSPVLAQGKSAGKGGDRGKSSESPGHSGGNPSSYANKGKNSTSGPHQLARDLGLSMGELSSWLKSWRSAYRNDRAYEATMGNLNSLPGRQYAYGDAFFALQAAIDACTAVICDPDDPLFDPLDPLVADVVAAKTAADTLFLATLPGNQTTFDPALRDTVDALVVQIGLAGAEAGLY